ncbi:MAG: CBS domain-containing protein [Bacteroidetes bacterium]|nr:CBS domain-containing protein [Bacteroidota bacterium]
MLTRDLLSQSLPYLHLQDNVYQVLQMMNDNHVTHLPVVEDDKYIGLVSEDDLLRADENDQLRSLQQPFPLIEVRDDDHFLKAVLVMVQNELSLVPVITDSKEMAGVLTYADLLKSTSDFMSLNMPGGIIVLEMEGKDYSFNEISRLVETNDAQITQLNSMIDPETGLLMVTLKINKSEVSDIVATFQRYDYNVKYYFGEEIYENELKSNYDNLMNYLNL